MDKLNAGQTIFLGRVNPQQLRSHLAYQLRQQCLRKQADGNFEQEIRSFLQAATRSQQSTPGADVEHGGQFYETFAPPVGASYKNGNRNG